MSIKTYCVNAALGSREESVVSHYHGVMEMCKEKKKMT